MASAEISEWVAGTLGFRPGVDDHLLREHYAPNLPAKQVPERRRECRIAFRTNIVTGAGWTVLMEKPCESWSCDEWATTEAGLYRRQIDPVPDLSINPVPDRPREPSPSLIFYGLDVIHYLPVIVGRDDEAVKQRRGKMAWINVTTYGGVRHYFTSERLASCHTDTPAHVFDVDDARAIVRSLLQPGIMCHKPGGPRSGGEWQFFGSRRLSSGGFNLGFCPPQVEDEVWSLLGRRSEMLFGFSWSPSDIVPDDVMNDESARTRLAGLYGATVKQVADRHGIELPKKKTKKDTGATDPYLLAG